MNKKKIQVKGAIINIHHINGNDYVSLTDIAKNSERKPANIITDWLRNSKTLLFLETWETLYNSNFKVTQMQDFRFRITDERFYLSTQKYIKETKAIGLVSKSGRNGGTFAHSEIAFDFCAWFNPQFKVYLYHEFQRLKREEEKNTQFYLDKIFSNSIENAQFSKFLLDDQKFPNKENE